VASAEVMKDNNITANKGEVSELQSSPNSLGERFELNESLPMVGGMEHSSPLYVLSNTGVEDERPNPSPQSCTSTGINLRGSRHLKTSISHSFCSLRKLVQLVHVPTYS